MYAPIVSTAFLLFNRETIAIFPCPQALYRFLLGLRGGWALNPLVNLADPNSNIARSPCPPASLGSIPFLTPTNNWENLQPVCISFSRRLKLLKISSRLSAIRSRIEEKICRTRTWKYHDTTSNSRPLRQRTSPRRDRSDFQHPTALLEIFKRARDPRKFAVCSHRCLVWTFAGLCGPAFSQQTFEYTLRSSFFSHMAHDHR